MRDAIVKSEAALVRLDTELHLAEFTRNARFALESDDGAALKEVVKRFVSKE